MARLGRKDRGLFERPAGSGVWWVRYYCPDGTPCRKGGLEKRGPRAVRAAQDGD
jgi:hypothetical protein